MSTDKSEPVKDKQERDSKLVEYQVCQQAINSGATSYWTVTGIFVGLSGVLLGAVIFGIISNQSLLDRFVNMPSPTTSGQVFVVQILATFVGLGMLVVYYALWRWMRRVRYLQQQGFRRMREIELALWMRNSLVITAIDRWEDLKVEEKARIRELGLEECCKAEKAKREYEIPSSQLPYRLIILVLTFLWGITIIGVWIVPLISNSV